MHTPEAGTNRLTPCPTCGRQLVFASASRLPPDVGDSDFDCFIIVEEPGHPARTYLLGGSADISIGDSPDCIIRLTEDQGDGHYAHLRRAAQNPSRWQIIPTRVADGTIQNLPLRPADLHHGNTVHWPRLRLRYHSHVTPQHQGPLQNGLSLASLPLGPSILAFSAFLVVVGANLPSTILPIASRDIRMLLKLLMIFILAPSLWIAALVWGLTRLRTTQGNLAWLALMLLLATLAIVARATMGIM